ncbi:hypothetical protein J7T55_001006 [Diaporthe amygdali]|uniref:uncharacterized protein n=1 Tax=Phomopsis amygdali TaxID=1214568 RepID=UPI0022FF21BD|nr:uncharacterized protein J7T55_001006 [Diaporthe amygdali]KAJ0120151.1 hypothetical protein J7T55_001006 [Diaporthe amygdali]
MGTMFGGHKCALVIYVKSFAHATAVGMFGERDSSPLKSAAIASHFQKSAASSNSTGNAARSRASTGSGSPSNSSGFGYDQYFVPPDCLEIFRDPAGSVTSGRDMDGGSPLVCQGSLEDHEKRECVNVGMRILDRSRTQAVSHASTYSTRLLDYLEYDFPTLSTTHATGKDYDHTERLSWGSDIRSYVLAKAAYIAVFERLYGQNQRMVEYQKAVTRQPRWKPGLAQLENGILKAQRNKDPKDLAAAEAKHKEHRKNYRRMSELTKNYKLRYKGSLSHLGSTLVHERFHVLTGLWIGTKKLGTPLRLGGGFANDYAQGEAGDWCEYQGGSTGPMDRSTWVG